MVAARSGSRRLRHGRQDPADASPRRPFPTDQFPPASGRGREHDDHQAPTRADPQYWAGILAVVALRDDGHDILCHLLTTLSGTVGGGIERDAPSRVSIAWQIDAE